MGCVPFLSHDSRLVLLDDLNIHSKVSLSEQCGHIPESAVLAVAEEMISNPIKRLLPRFDLALDLFARRSGLRGQSVIEYAQKSRHEESHDYQRDENPVEADTCTEHGDDLVAPGHLGKGVEKGQKETDRNAQDDDARDLQQIVARYEGKSGMSGKKIRQIDTQIPD